MAKNGTYDIELKAFDDLFETDESRADMKRERLMDIPVSNIRDFPDHPLLTIPLKYRAIPTLNGRMFSLYMRLKQQPQRTMLLRLLQSMMKS